MEIYRIVTERCILSPLTNAHVTRVHQLWTGPHVRRYLWDDQVIPVSKTKDILQENVRLFRQQKFGVWGVGRSNADDLIGFAGYWYFRDPPERELLIGFAPEYWGQGLATEVGQALIHFGFAELGFPEVRASTDAPNGAAKRVMEKLNMTFVRRAEDGGLDTLFYTILRDQWRAPDAPYTLTGVTLPS